MSVLKLEQFGGELPAWDEHLLPAGQASYSLNSYLFSGALLGWRTPKLLRALQDSAAKFIYRVPTTTQGTASAYLAFIANVNDGDALKLGEEIYTFTATVTAAYEVLLGASAADSATNLYKALTLTGVDGTTYGSGTVANPDIDDTKVIQSTHDFGSGAIPTIFVQASDFGAAFNTIVVTESTSATRIIWLYDLDLTHTTATFKGGLNQSFDNSITGAATWLEFVDPDTNIVRTPIVDDKFGRYYFASPSLPPRYNTYDRIVAGANPWLLGVPAPGCAPGVDVTGGGDRATLGFAPGPANSSSANDTPGSNFIFLIPIAPAGAMTLNDVSMLVESTSTTANFSAVLYSDNAGVPFELMNVGDEVTGCVAGDNVVSSFINPTGLLLGVKYWIGFIADEAIDIRKNDDSGTTGVKHTATYSNGPPIFAPTMTTGQPNWMVWGDLTTSSILQGRAYVYTWLTAYSEEGPPSPPTLVNGWSNAEWKIDLFTPFPDDMGANRNITKTRIYRTIPATNGQTTYFFVAEVDVTTAIYTDTIGDDVVALNTILPSTNWFPPPESLEGIMSMPNGMVVGFKGNELWFAEPYRPHAWPPGYVLTTEFPIVGIGVAGQSVIACTSVSPYVASGVNPGAMALTKTQHSEPCISRGSIISTDNGVFFASPNGLIKVSSGGIVDNTTDLWITREKWRTSTPQKAVRAVLLASSYFAFGSLDNGDASVAQQGYTIELTDDSKSFTIWPQPGGHRVGFNRLTAPGAVDISNVQLDPWSGIGLLIQGTNVYYYDFSDTAPTVQTYVWRSKLYQQQYKKNFEAVKVYFKVPLGAPTQNTTRKTSATNDTSWASLDADRYGYIRFYADETLVTVREIRSSGELLRVLSGFKYETWQIEIEARVLISNVQLATSVKELASV